MAPSPRIKLLRIRLCVLYQCNDDALQRWLTMCLSLMRTRRSTHNQSTLWTSQRHHNSSTQNTSTDSCDASRSAAHHLQTSTSTSAVKTSPAISLWAVRRH